MRNSELKNTMNAAGRILLAWILAIAQCAWAQDGTPANNQQQKLNVSAAAKAEAPMAKAQHDEEESASQAAGESTAKGAPQDGIKVHGHWIIEVRNPDGSLVTHREFENSLCCNGPALLAGCLVNGCSKGGWDIIFYTVNAGTVCANPINGNVCDINPAIPTLNPGGTSFTLNASFTAATAGSINHVGTNANVVGGGFSGTGLAPTAVLAGQIVQFSVVFSFS